MDAWGPAEMTAFVPDGQVFIPGARHGGVLEGTRFVVKDVFDIEGCVTGAGSPDWRRTHRAAQSTAGVVRRVLSEGASLIGKTVCDELTFGFEGENQHYGSPMNPAAPERVPGGSSSGSASVAAAGLADFAFGTDTGGSVRIPASYCGVFGLRTSHGRIPNDGVFPLAPSFDTVGWMATDAGVFTAVGGAVFATRNAVPGWQKLLIGTDCFALASEQVRALCRRALASVASALGLTIREVTVAPRGLLEWADCFQELQAREVGRTHGDWIRRVRPALGAGVRERFSKALRYAECDVSRAEAARITISDRVQELLTDGSVLCIPTAPAVPPLRGGCRESRHGLSQRILALTSVAGLSGTPQVTIPIVTEACPPVGLSLIAKAGEDEKLLRAAEIVACSLKLDAEPCWNGWDCSPPITSSPV